MRFQRNDERVLCLRWFTKKFRKIHTLFIFSVVIISFTILWHFTTAVVESYSTVDVVTTVPSIKEYREIIPPETLIQKSNNKIPNNNNDLNINTNTNTPINIIEGEYIYNICNNDNTYDYSNQILFHAIAITNAIKQKRPSIAIYDSFFFHHDGGDAIPLSKVIDTNHLVQTIQ